MCIEGFGGETEGKRPLGRRRHRWEEKLNWIFKKVMGGVLGLD